MASCVCDHLLKDKFYGEMISHTLMKPILALETFLFKRTINSGDLDTTKKYIEYVELNRAATDIINEYEAVEGIWVDKIKLGKLLELIEVVGNNIPEEDSKVLDNTRLLIYDIINTLT